MHDLLTAAGEFQHHRYMRITARLISDDGSTTPVLAGFNLDWVCVDDL
jgi:hypothetical protein